jgi:putative hydrolase
MADDGSDEFQDMLRKFLENGEHFDIAELAKAAGLPGDAATIEKMLTQLHEALSQGNEGITEQMVRDTATKVANQQAETVAEATVAAAESALHLASLWLDEATSISPLTVSPSTMTRGEWARATIPVWIQISEPVAQSISTAGERALGESIPEGESATAAGAFAALRRLGGTLFSLQLGQIIGQLSGEVLSGGDIGIPLLDGILEHELRAVLIPQNITAFAEGLDIPLDDVMLYLAIREIAHARLFKHSKWLKLGLVASITDYANGISINAESMRDAMSDIDLTDAEALRRLVSDGSLIPPKTDDQVIALTRIETLLALIEGWVDVVADNAAHRLPSRNAIAEMVRRHRAVGRPGEKALAGLIGIDARPRRLREAASMWRALDAAVSPEQRDSVWAHPDVMPTGGDIDDPAALISRLSGNDQPPDAMDDAIRRLIDEDGTVEGD